LINSINFIKLINLELHLLLHLEPTIIIYQQPHLLLHLLKTLELSNRNLIQKTFYQLSYVFPTFSYKCHDRFQDPVFSIVKNMVDLLDKRLLEIGSFFKYFADRGSEDIGQLTEIGFLEPFYDDIIMVNMLSISYKTEWTDQPVLAVVF